MSIEFNCERLQELYDIYGSIAEATRRYCEENGLEYTDSLRRKASRRLDSGSSTKTNQYNESPKILSARKDDGTLMTPQEFCETYGLEFSEVRSYKLITHLAEPTYNIASHIVNDSAEDKITEEVIRRTVENCMKDFGKPLVSLDTAILPEEYDPEKLLDMARGTGNLVFSSYKAGIDKALRIIITDVHIGLDPGSGGTSLYDGKWDAERLEECRGIILEHVRDKVNTYGSFDEVHVIDLGDLMDGWNSQTTRGGHHLQQNMSNEEMFDTAVRFKVNLLRDVQHITGTKVRMFSVTNDNHGGSFNYVVNSAVRFTLEQMGIAEEVVVMRRFIEHYQYGNHVFILSHGKDSQHQNKGLSARMDNRAKEMVENYMKKHSLYQPDLFVTFEKGDSHIQVLDDSCNDFSYNSYLAFSPPSQWVQHNFVGSRSGFNLMVVDKFRNEKELTTIYL